MLVSTVIVFIGIFVYASIVGAVTTGLADLNAMSARHKQRMNQVMQYFRQQQAP